MGDSTQLFGRREVSKAELHDWKIMDGPGTFIMIPKDQLNIDHTYQRDNVSNSSGTVTTVPGTL